MLWVEKYRPKAIKDVVASKKIVEKINSWAGEWRKGKQKPLLLAGPPGTGKTSIALALANTFGWEVIELNASDQRNWQIINRIVGEGAFNETISDEGEFFSTSKGKLKLIILDEVDNIHRKEDAGGEGALIRLIRRKPVQPLILIANEPYKLSTELRNLCEVVTFKRLDIRQVAKVLEKICTEERIRADRKTLEAIANNAGGDLRAAINDLQAIAEGRDIITIGDVVMAKRTQETDVFKVMQKIFKTMNPAIYNEAMLLDESPENLVDWIEENLPLEYRNEALVRAYLVLSRADLFLGRVKRRQYYRLWKYANYLMTVGVQQVKSEEGRGFTKYQRPARWQMLAYTKSRREKFRKILKKIGKYSHLSTKKASTEMYYFIKALISNTDIKTAANVAVFYDFSEEDIAFMTDEKRAKKIIEYIDNYGLHRIDESFLDESKVGKEKKEEEEEVEDVKKAKKGLTLDFFSEV